MIFPSRDAGTAELTVKPYPAASPAFRSFVHVTARLRHYCIVAVAQ